MDPSKIIVMEREFKPEDMTNSELNIRMIELSNEYEAKKKEVIEMIHGLEELDKQFVKLKDELNKRKQF